MPGYDAWLEAPYNDAAIAEEEFEEVVELEKEILYKELTKDADDNLSIINDHVSDPDYLLAQLLMYIARKDFKTVEKLIDEQVDLIAVWRANNG